MQVLWSVIYTEMSKGLKIRKVSVCLHYLCTDLLHCITLIAGGHWIQVFYFNENDDSFQNYRSPASDTISQQN